MDLMRELYSRAQFSQQIKYIISSYIREYDISKANINILLYNSAITLEQYNYYLSLDKLDRQVQVGWLLRDDKNLAKILSRGLLDIKKLFFESNNLEYRDILSIKNDAIFIDKKIPAMTKFGNIEFVLKNIYTSFYKLKDLEVYYFHDTTNNNEKIDIKGIKAEKLELHKNYFLEFLLVLFCSAQVENINETINLLSMFYNNYINLELDVGYYRTFNSESIFRIKGTSKFSNFKADFIDEENKKYIDIGYNLNILHELHGIYSEIFFIQNNRRR